MINSCKMVIQGIQAFPVWKDIILSTDGTAFSASTAVGFQLSRVVVSAAGVTSYVSVMEGRAAKRPGDTYITVRLNDAVADYVRAQLRHEALEYENGAPTGVVRKQDGCYSDRDCVQCFAPLFRLRWYDLSNSASYADAQFYVYGDWTYRYLIDYDNPPVLRSDPIDGVFDPRQVLYFSTLTGYYLTLIRDRDNAVAWTMQSQHGAAESGIPLQWFANVSVLEDADRVEGDTFTLRAMQPTPGGNVVLGSLKLTYVETCARYVLYYVNAMGGLDWFVIRGNVKTSDALTRTEYTRRGKTDLSPSYDDLTDPGVPWVGIQERGRDVLAVAVQKTLEMHTHWLTDEQSLRMHNLIESPAVFVHDLNDDVVRPAVITDSVCEYKTYKTNERKLVSYVLTVELANPTERR